MDFLTDTFYYFGELLYHGYGRWIVFICIAIWVFGGEPTRKRKQEEEPYYTHYEIV